MASIASRARSSHLVAPVAREPLLQRADVEPADNRGSSFPWVETAGLGYLTFSSAVAAYRSRDDTWNITFVAFSYLDLLLLFYCLRRYEHAEAGSQLRNRLKSMVWMLTAALTLVFASKVAAVMPAPAVAAFVWVLAVAVVAGGFVEMVLR